MERENLEDSGNFYKYDSIYCKRLIGKKVEVRTVDERIHHGYVYVIDPESNSIVLTNKTNDGKYDTDILLGMAVKYMKVLNDEKNSDSLFIESAKPILELDKQLIEKKNNLINWLRNRCFEVEEDGCIIKLGNELTIAPPYTQNECYCGNTIILERIQNILKMYEESCDFIQV